MSSRRIGITSPFCGVPGMGPAPYHEVHETGLNSSQLQRYSLRVWVPGNVAELLGSAAVMVSSNQGCSALLGMADQG